MKSFAVIVIAIIALASAQSIDECLQKDSISCVQRSLYKRARDFFENDNLEIVGGVSLVKSDAGRASRSGKNLVYEQEIEQANSVVERQSVLENFVGEEVGEFFQGRSLRINFAPALEKIGASARAITESIPTELRQAADEVAEGRGKKKMIKKILPLLLIAKAKLGALATIAYFALALIAKKAIIASLISLALTSFVGLRGLWEKKSSFFGGHTTGGSFNAGGWNSGASTGGWSSGGSAGGWEEGPNYAAQSQAFSGYH